MAPEVGLEPTTLRLTAECSAIELLRNVFFGPAGDSRAYSVITNRDRGVKGYRHGAVQIATMGAKNPFSYTDECLYLPTAFNYGVQTMTLSGPWTDQIASQLPWICWRVGCCLD
jgi:hypothetical protein